MSKKSQQNNNGPTLDQKWLDKLPDGFWDSAQTMSTEDLKKKLVEVEDVIISTERDMKNDPKLTQAKEDVKILAGAYKDLITPSKAVVKAVISILKDRGVV